MGSSKKNKHSKRRELDEEEEKPLLDDQPLGDGNDCCKDGDVPDEVFGEAQVPHVPIILPAGEMMLAVPLAIYDEEKEMDQWSVRAIAQIRDAEAEQHTNFESNLRGFFFDTNEMVLRNFLLRVENTKNVFVLLTILNIMYMLLAIGSTGLKDMQLTYAKIVVLVICLLDVLNVYAALKRNKVYVVVGAWLNGVLTAIIFVVFTEVFFMQSVVTLLNVQLVQRLKEVSHVEDVFHIDLFESMDGRIVRFPQVGAAANQQPESVDELHLDVEAAQPPQNSR